MQPHDFVELVNKIRQEPTAQQAAWILGKTAAPTKPAVISALAKAHLN